MNKEWGNFPRDFNWLTIYSGNQIIPYWGDADTYFRRDTENGIGVEAEELDGFVNWWEKVIDAGNNPLFDNL